MNKKLFFVTSIFLIVCLMMTGCSVVAPKLELTDLTLEYGEVYELPTEA